MTPLRLIILLPLLALVSGCNAVVLSPAGDVAAQQRDILLLATWLMLLVVVPVMVLTAWFAWHYRQSNRKAEYTPDWHHSTYLELAVWAAPLLVVICLGAVTWKSTHLLDPYRPLDRIAADQPVPADATPLEVDVVALDWKWLFIYPDYNVAAVNELAAPLDRPIHFRLTAATVMNTFYVPALAGQVYAMPGMETVLNAVINEPGDFKGFSANYSGAGFSGMRFVFHGQSQTDFDAWIAKLHAAETVLDRPAYLALAAPSENVPVTYYHNVDADLFQAIVEHCAEPGQLCRSTLALIDGEAPCAPTTTASSDL